MDLKTGKKSLPLSEGYRLPGPGPVALVAAAKKTSIKAMSRHAMLEFEPPPTGCVINIPALKIAQKR